MKNEYTAPEVIEIGEAQEVILGGKPLGVPDENQTQFGSSDLDE